MSKKASGRAGKLPKGLSKIATYVSKMEEGLQYSTAGWEIALRDMGISSAKLVAGVRLLLEKKVLRQPKGQGTPFFTS